MKRLHLVAAALAMICAPSASAQQPDGDGLGEVVVTASRGNIPYAQQNRPVVGLQRQADGAVIAVSISSDSRDEATRKKEIHAVLLAAMGRAASARIELVSGGSQLFPVTKANYTELPFQFAGRADTSKVDFMVKTRLDGSAVTAEKRLTDFIKAVPRSDRGVMDKTGNLTLTIVNPDQYRDQVIRLIAESAQHSAAIFGPEYRFNISGIDDQIAWSQVSSTDIFLYLPYRYTIYPR